MNPCANHSVTVGPHGQSIYIFGGRGVEETLLSRCLCFNLNRLIWSSKTPMKSGRKFHASVLGNDENIYIIGGFDNGSLSSCVKYNPYTDRYCEIADMPSSRHAHSAVATSNGKIYVFGGVIGGEYLESCLCYDIKTDTWSHIASMNEPRAHFAAALL
eukprot:TRINITY_DN12260_c0_g1_i1.p1 TRINITY_DN12260_c0_g1~~TRINITY_DN12260_c0_g1_i1.p1  ORF type:complete len:168 (+),score=30.03 TRINITY_DN12260_c0_g1_i1:32-505(+)